MVVSVSLSFVRAAAHPDYAGSQGHITVAVVVICTFVNYIFILILLRVFVNNDDCCCLVYHDCFQCFPQVWSGLPEVSLEGILGILELGFYSEMCFLMLIKH